LNAYFIANNILDEDDQALLAANFGRTFSSNKRFTLHFLAKKVQMKYAVNGAYNYYRRGGATKILAGEIVGFKKEVNPPDRQPVAYFCLTII
jgi:hypothetical protein